MFKLTVFLIVFAGSSGNVQSITGYATDFKNQASCEAGAATAVEQAPAGVEVRATCEPVKVRR